MPSTSPFYAHSVTTSGSGTGTNVAWTVSETFISTNPIYTLMASTPPISYNEVTNYLIVKDFADVDIPVGSTLVGFHLSMEVSLNSVADSANMESVETYLQYNGSNYGSNLAPNINSDWGYSNFSIGDSTTLYGLTLDMLQSPSFGVKISGKNVQPSELYSASLATASLRLYYTYNTPEFIYNGDSTSEVFVTLDKNPEVTNPTTTFGVYRGLPDTTSSGSDLGYMWGIYYTAPVVGDPSGGGFDDLVYDTSIGAYTTNYLSTPTVSSTLSDYSVTDHVMSYDISTLTAGNTYRRGLALWNLRFPIGKRYDLLYFNIEVIDTTPSPEPIHPYLIYNGDTTSEITITLDKNPAVTNPTTEFGVYHGDPDTTSDGTDAGYHWGVLYTDGSGYIIPENNYINTPDTTSTLSNGSISYHDITYDVTDLVVGETYRRAIVLWNLRTPPLSFTSKEYDKLWVNIDLIDTSAVRRRNTGTFGSFVI